jgi:HPr kinase/phosphorylase
LARARKKKAVKADELALGGTRPPIGVTVGEFVGEYGPVVKLDLVEGHDGLNRQIRGAEINRPGLALAGFFGRFSYKQIQVIGQTELSFLKTLTEERRVEVFAKILSYKGIPCFIVARNKKPPGTLLVKARAKKIPVLVSKLRTTELIALTSDYLREKFAPQVKFHGNLLDVYGLGVLILGEATTGKSECALDLIMRGHKMVADDIVFVKRKFGEELIGEGSPFIHDHMEIRGLGILNVSRLFGVRAVLERKPVDLMMKIEMHDPDKEYDRTGLDVTVADVLGVDIPLITIPVVPGKNISTVVEVAAMNMLLKRRGYDSAREFNKGLMREIEGE